MRLTERPKQQGDKRYNNESQPETYRGPNTLDTKRGHQEL
jgi:hypothetical protein